MIDLSLGSLLAYAVFFVLGAFLGAFLGVLLGRRSKTANATVDRIQKEYDEKLLAAREEIVRLRNKAK